MIYASFSGSKKAIIIGTLKLNSIGLEVNYRILIEYGNGWNQIFQLAVMDSNLIVAHNHGISTLSLESHMIREAISSEQYQVKSFVPFNDGFLFTSKQCIYMWNQSGVHVFAGDEKEQGSRDGKVLYSRFYEPTGIAVEFGNVIYVSDKIIGSIKILTPLKETSIFLGALHCIAQAFSVHEKHKQFTVKTLPEAISLVKNCDEVLSKNVDTIRSMNSISGSFNGPEGSVSAVTINSIKMLLWGLERLQKNTLDLNYNNVNLLSCMTLSVENLHSTVNKKQTTQTMITYAQSFSIAIKESIKAVTKWGAHYFTSRDTWYPLPDSAISLSELQFPKKSTTSVVKHPLTSDQKREMREWASSNGAVVRQRSCRQETTMARAGTLPENAYFEELIPQQQSNRKCRHN